jgi:hypothetical protein
LQSQGDLPHPIIEPSAVSQISRLGCQMLYFQTKNQKLGKFWRALDCKIWIDFEAIWNILRTFGTFYGHLVHVVFIWYIFPVLVSWTKKNLATLFRGMPSSSSSRQNVELNQGDQIG